MIDCKNSKRKPSLIRFILAIGLLFPLWLVTLELGIRPKSFNTATSRTILAWYLLPPLLLVGGGYVLLRIHYATKAHAIEAQQAVDRKISLAALERQRQEAAAHAAANHSREIISLEVRGLGLSLEKNRNVHVWDRMETGKYQTIILPADPKAYPWSKDEKYDYYKKRNQDALAQAGGWFTEEWEIPVFLVGPELRNGEFLGHLDAPMRNDRLMAEDGGERYPLISGFTSYRMEAGMHFHPFTVIQVYHSTAPEQVLPDVFAFFDAHPEVPAVMVHALDSLSERNLLRNFEQDRDTVENGYRKPGELTESITSLVLARRDRVEAMRAYAPKEASPHHRFPWGHAQEEPQVKPGFRPTEFLPKPWDKWQLIQFDRLPVLGRIHRPKTVSYLRPDGSPMKPSERQAAFAAGWKAALGTLREGRQPARVLYDHGSAQHGARLAPLGLALHQVGPDLDLHQDGINLHRCLGDLGADASFVNVALGVYASHRRNDVSACVSLRRKDSALIMMVSPPTAEERAVPHPGGKDHLNVHDPFGVMPYGWLPEPPKGMLVHSVHRVED